MDRGGAEPSTSLPDTAVPLLDGGARSERGGSGSRNGRGRTLEAARYLRRAGSSRFMREQSVVVRETAAEQLEERQSDWAYSRPVVVLDLIWNLAFVTVAAVVLLLSQEEKPPAPLRVWVLGYTLQCIVHMICVWSEHRRRRELVADPAYRGSGSSQPGQGRDSGSRRRSDGGEADEDADAEEVEQLDARPSLAKRLESVNTMFSFLWWMVGFWCVLTGLDDGFQDAPLLSWLCAVFLAFDVFFVVFCVALACVIGIAVCCCLPCIIAILYAVADQEGASEEDIKALPRYKFRQLSVDSEEAMPEDDSKAARRGGLMALLGAPKGQLVERHLPAEDAECCICLSTYDDAAELRELPCLHHFHCTCIDKWLRTKPTCPLCKYDIVQGREASGSSSSSSSEEEGSRQGDDNV